MIGRGLLERRADGFPPITVTSAHATQVPGNVQGLPNDLRSVRSDGLAIPEFWSGVRQIAETVAMIPLEVLRRDAAGTVIPDTGRLSQLLGVSFNRENSAGQGWEFVALSLLLWGNAYLWKERDRDGRVVALWPLHPSRVAVGRDPVTRRKVFGVASSTDFADVTPAMSEDILHFRAPGLDPLVGWSLLRFQRDLLNRAGSEAEYQTAQLDNGARFSGFLSTTGRLSDDGARKLSARWHASQAGAGNAGKTPVLEDGLTFQQVSMSAADAQFLEQRQFTRQQFAIILNLPASRLLASTGDTMQYSSAAMDLKAFVQVTIRPWTARIERALLQDTDFPWGDPLTLTPRFSHDALTDADRSQRYEDYETGRRAGFLLPSDMRRTEHLAPVDGIDDAPPPPPRRTTTEGSR